MSKELNKFSPETVVIDIAADLSEEFSDLSRELDKQRLAPELRVSHYSFEGENSLYHYPAIVRDYIELFNVSIDKIDVSVKKTAGGLPTITILIKPSTSDYLELSIPADASINSPFQLSILGGQAANPPKKYDVSPYEISQLLISMALPPSDASEIVQAKADDEKVIELNPRDNQILYLIENSLENQATRSSVTQKFERKFVENEYSDSTRFTLISTKKSDDNTEFDAKARSQYVEEGTSYAYDMSTKCSSLDSPDGLNDVVAEGSSVRISIDGTERTILDKATVISYMSTLVKALAQQRSKTKPAQL